MGAPPKEVRAFLARYGYGVGEDGASWAEEQAEPKAAGIEALGAHPRVEIRVLGHIEEHEHTRYTLKCSISAWPDGRLSFCSWTVSRRLREIRKGLHDPIKEQLGADYAAHFGATPFAHKGGP